MGAARAHTRGESGEGGHERGRPAGGGSEHGGRPRPPALAPHPRPSPRHATRLPTHRPRAADDAAPSPDSPVDPDHRGLGARSAARPQPGGEARSGGRRRGVPRAAAGARIPGARPRARLGLGASRPDRAKAGIAGGDGGVGADPGRAVAAREAGEPGRDNRGRRRGHGGKTDGVPDPGPSNPDRPRPARHGTANPPPHAQPRRPQDRVRREGSPPEGPRRPRPSARALLSPVLAGGAAPRPGTGPPSPTPPHVPHAPPPGGPGGARRGWGGRQRGPGTGRRRPPCLHLGGRRARQPSRPLPTRGRAHGQVRRGHRQNRPCEGNPQPRHPVGQETPRGAIDRQATLRQA